MANLRDQCSLLEMQNLCRRHEGERIHRHRLRVHRATKDSLPSERRPGVACHRSATPQRNPSLSHPFGNRVAGRQCIGECGERSCRAWRQTIRYQMTVASRAMSLQLTLIGGRSHRGKVGSCGRSVLRIDPVEISFKPPTAPFSPRHVEIKTSGSADVELSDVRWKDVRQTFVNPPTALKCTRMSAQARSSRRITIYITSS